MEGWIVPTGHGFVTCAFSGEVLEIRALQLAPGIQTLGSWSPVDSPSVRMERNQNPEGLLWELTKKDF